VNAIEANTIKSLDSTFPAKVNITSDNAIKTKTVLLADFNIYILF